MLSETSTRWLTTAAIGGTGLMSGLFFAYSTFTMSGIRRLPGTHGLRAMQQINRAANSSAPLMVGLFGTGAISTALGVAAAGDLDTTASALRLTGASLYMVGALGFTVAFHVPRNNALARVDPDAPGAVEAWRRYAKMWTAGNHVRTVAALAAAVIYAVSLRAGHDELTTAAPIGRCG